MRVLDITSFFSDVCGGIKTYYREKARVLPMLGVECHFVVPGVVTSTEPWEAGTLHRIAGPPMFGSPFYRRFPTGDTIRELVTDIQPDVIELGSHYLLPSMVRRVLSYCRSRPVLVGFYHADFPETYVEPAFRWLGPLRRGPVSLAWSLVRTRHRGYDATLVASRHVQERLERHGVSRVHCVGLGVDVETFHPQARDPAFTSAMGVEPGTILLGYSGRLSSDKGFSVMLAAMDELHRHTRAHMVVAGDGPKRAELETFASTRPWIHVLGYLPDVRAVARMLASVDVILAPGPNESFSLSTAEALACGTPVIGADQRGNAELVLSSGGGTIFASGRASALVDATQTVLRMSSQHRHELGERGRAHIVATSTWEHVFSRMHGIYAGLIRTRPMAA